MLGLLFTAQTGLTPWSTENILVLISGMLGGTAVLSTIVLLAARGYWQTNVVPMLENEIRKWYSDPSQVDARNKERLVSIKDWYDKREQRDEREKEMQNVLRLPAVASEITQAVKLIIDNEIKRSDGLISREIHTQVNAMESRIVSKLDELVERMRDDLQLKQQILQKIGKLEGAINAMSGSAIVGGTISAPPSLPERAKPR